MFYKDAVYQPNALYENLSSWGDVVLVFTPSSLSYLSLGRPRCKATGIPDPISLLSGPVGSSGLKLQADHPVAVPSTPGRMPKGSEFYHCSKRVFLTLSIF